MAVFFKAISAMEKCFADEDIVSKKEVTSGVALRGEEYCFEIAYTSNDPAHYPKCVFELFVNSPLADCIKISTVEQVPVRLPTYSNPDEDYLRTKPGLYPDLLVPVSAGEQVFVVTGELKSFFVSVKLPEDIAPGKYDIEIGILWKGEKFDSATVSLEVLNKVLPPQELVLTEWFYTDCIANYYELEVFSDRHFEYIGNFMKTAVDNGINTILMPVFTPPLDTAVGGERRTTQLVDVEHTADGEWKFGFDKLTKWVETAKAAGVKYHEVSHLYTQWGAAHAPKVMGYENGEYKRLFGWETNATGEEYRTFLRAFLKAFLDEAKKLGISDKLFFHISDEPSTDCLEAYKAAKAQIADLLEGYTIIDALSDFNFYKTGAVEHPIPSNDHIEAFLEAKVPGLWTYYCCSQAYKVSNRFLAMPLSRTRIIGAQMWKYNIVGFLHWGYNFWNSQYSIREINPFAITDGDYFSPAGDCFTVYPGPHGMPYETIRRKVFTMALNDMRAMSAAAEIAGRDAVIAAIDADGEVQFADYPRGTEAVEGIRARVNEIISGAERT